MRVCKRAGILFLPFFLIFSSGLKAKVSIVKKDDGFQLVVEAKPFVVRGVCYNPTPIGEGPTSNFLTLKDYKPWVVDGPLMEEIGINAIRIYDIPLEALPQAKEMINYLYQKHRIYTIVSDWLGFWDYPGPFYADPEFRKRVEKKVLKVVNELKDQPGVLMWVLGNENNYSFRGNIQPWSSPEIEKIKDPRKQIEEKAKIYYRFVERLARKIKRIDRNHPIGMGNGELLYLDIAKKICKNIDFLGLIIYRGKTFGNAFKGTKFRFNKPILFIEFGADSFDAYRKKEDQDAQAMFIKSQWKQIFKNIYPYGEKNCLGGALFEWTDEWWKHNPCSMPTWRIQDKGAGWSNGAYYFDIKAPQNLNMNEEWFGIVGLSEERENGVNKRIPKRIYYELGLFFKDPYKYINNEGK